MAKVVLAPLMGVVLASSVAFSAIFHQNAVLLVLASGVALILLCAIPVIYGTIFFVLVIMGNQQSNSPPAP